MLCIKCKKEIPDGSAYCNYCGKKQVVMPKPKYHKREHGTGTIRCDKRYKKPWIAIAPSSRYGQGRQYIGCYDTRREASEALDEFIRNGRPKLYNATVADVYGMWSKVHFQQVSDSAVSLYSSMWKRFSEVMELPIRELRAAHIQEIVNAGTSKSACEIIKTMAVMLCKYAMENDIVSKNYAEFVKIPKFEKKEKRIFTRSEIEKLWQRSDDKRVQAILLMIYTGFRIGEIVALNAEDIHIREGYIVGGEKTRAGKNRIVPIPPGIPELKAFLKAWTAETSQGRLFPMTVRSFRDRVFYDGLICAGLIKDADSCPYTPHSTRHTFASLSAAAGVQPDKLQKIIGHASFNTTADIYIHQDIPALVSEMEKLSR